jgi:hypothetical protein
LSARRLRVVRLSAVGLLCALLVGCATPAPAPSTAPGPMTEVEAALTASGIMLVAAADTTPSSSSCVPGPPIRTMTFYQEPPDATYNAAKLPIEALVFVSSVERRAFEARISSDGSTITGPGCSAISDYVATPHWYGAGPYLFLVVSDDPAVAAGVGAAAARLGPQ